MKVLGIVCSPRKAGNTEIMMEAALTGARSYGAETELWTTSGKDLKPCDACDACRKNGGKCRIKDDMQELYPKILEAEGLIFASPCYFYSVTAQAKIVIDRLYCIYYQYVLPNKVAGVITVGTSQGLQNVVQQFSDFIKLAHMFLADSTFGFAFRKGEVIKDDYAIKSSEELGKQVVSLIKQQNRWPEEYRRPLYHVLRYSYGIEDYPLRHTRQQE